MKKLLKTITKAIDCPLMDTHNISPLIAQYLEHTIFYLYHDTEICTWRNVITTACFLATGKEHAWELYIEHSQQIPSDFKIEKEEFLKNLGASSSHGIYLTTQGCINHMKIQFIDDRDDYEFTEYQYKRPTKNVERKKCIESAQVFNTWYAPMIDVMMDGLKEPETFNILKRPHPVVYI